MGNISLVLGSSVFYYVSSIFTCFFISSETSWWGLSFCVALREIKEEKFLIFFISLWQKDDGGKVVINAQLNHFFLGLSGTKFSLTKQKKCGVLNLFLLWLWLFCIWV